MPIAIPNKTNITASEIKNVFKIGCSFRFLHRLSDFGLSFGSASAVSGCLKNSTAKLQNENNFDKTLQTEFAPGRQIYASTPQKANFYRSPMRIPLSAYIRTRLQVLFVFRCVRFAVF